MQPVGLAVGVALVLPDRHARLHLVDDPATGVEGRIAMRGAGADPDRQFPDREIADAMHATGVDRAELRQRFLHDAPALGFGQFDIGLVAQSLHRPALVVVAHPAFKRGEGTGALVQQALAQRRDVEGSIGDAEALHATRSGGRVADRAVARWMAGPASCRKALPAFARMTTQRLPHMLILPTPAG